MGTGRTSIYCENYLLEQINSPLVLILNELDYIFQHQQGVRLWKLQNPLFTVFRGHQSNLNQVAISPNGEITPTTGWDYVTNFWQCDGTLMRSLKGHTNGVSSVVFSPDAQFIATGSADKTIKLWKTGSRHS
ncbi:MAG: AAA-like domain-containing protein [Cuspidothrix sp.]